MKKIYLADITYFNPYTDPQITIPLNIGFIQSYAEKFYSDHFEFRLFKDPKKLIGAISADPPDILGLSCYYWNMQFDVYAARFVKEKNPNALVVAGGPQIDFKHGDMSFKEEQFQLHEEFNGKCDFYVINEGELAFNNFLERYLLVGHEKLFDEPINGGVHFINDHDYLGGSYLGVDMDLDEMPSPILSGKMDEFLTEDFMPMIQSSRLCPYLCTFCSSGKLRGKIRGFSIETVKNEIDYIADIYKDFSYKRIWISDENFGILKRDKEIAEYLYKSKRVKGYPQGVKVYFDKKFQSNSMEASLHLADMESDGVTLAFQSLNKETLKAIKRINLNDEEIGIIIKWAHKHKFPISTQLIQGLPYETKKTFMDTIEYLFQKNVNNIGIFQCMLFKGTELNRSDSRKDYGLKTKWRPCYLPSYDQINGEFICEAEEIIVSNKWMSFDDYLALNKIGFMSYLFTVSEYFSRLVHYLVNYTDIHIVKFFDDIMNPKDRSLIDPDYRKFLDDYDKERINELSDTYEEAKQKMKSIFKENNYTVGSPSRLNVLFASRLIYKENDWFPKAINKKLDSYNLNDRDLLILRDLIKICDSEWIPLNNLKEIRNLSISGATHKYLGTINNFNGIKRSDKYEISLSVSSEQEKILSSYIKKYSSQQLKNDNYLINALDFISPRRRLRYENMKIVD